MSASLAISSTQQRDRSTPEPESRVKPTLRATAAVPLSRRTGERAAVRPGWEHWGLDLSSEELPPGFGRPGRRVTLAGADHSPGGRGCSPGGRRSQPRRTQVTCCFSRSPRRKGWAVCRLRCGCGHLGTGLGDAPTSVVPLPPASLMLEAPSALKSPKGLAWRWGLSKPWVESRGWGGGQVPSSTLWTVPPEAQLVSQTHRDQDVFPEVCPPQTPVIQGTAPVLQALRAEIRVPPLSGPLHLHSPGPGQSQRPHSASCRLLQAPHGWSRGCPDTLPLPSS